MKFTLTIFLFLLFGHTNNSSMAIKEKMELSPCPSSPNCVSTQEKRRRKRMNPIPFQKTLKYSRKKIKFLLEMAPDRPNVTLIKETDNYLHYEFKTKLGKFIDDVEFLFDEKTKQIHFRSASRKGWSDMGKNKRRMRKIRRKFKNRLVTMNTF